MFLEHVNLTVTDLAKSTDFYRRLFGFDLRWEGKTSAGEPAAHVGDDRSYIALFQSARQPRAEKSYAEAGMNHFGFVVDDLHAMKDRLDSLGVTPTAEADYEPGKRLYFLDPDRIEVELVEYDGNSV